MRTKRRNTATAVAAMAMVVLGTTGTAQAGGGATVTSASGPTYLYGTSNPLSGMELAIHGVQTPSGHTAIQLHVEGLDPALAGETFGAHVHVNACGADPAAAGGHYKNLSLPASDPEAREIWLDFTVAADGTADAHAERPWVFDGSARSVVVHALPTDATGAAGARLACTNALFHT